MRGLIIHESALPLGEDFHRCRNDLELRELAHKTGLSERVVRAESSHYEWIFPTRTQWVTSRDGLGLSDVQWSSVQMVTGQLEHLIRADSELSELVADLALNGLAIGFAFDGTERTSCGILKALGITQALGYAMKQPIVVTPEVIQRRVTRTNGWLYPPNAKFFKEASYEVGSNYLQCAAIGNGAFATSAAGAPWRARPRTHCKHGDTLRALRALKKYLS